MEKHENSYQENLADYGGLEANVSGGFGARYGPVAVFRGGGPQDATGTRLLAKKLKKNDWNDGKPWVPNFST